jgi:NAD(P)-dependent dehydrogenase (short-subunit alcohol dehydrogenase family)
MMNVMELFRLDGKVAIITGGSRGLGFWMAEALAEVGANVVLCARKLEPCEEAAKAIRETGVRSLAVGCDVTDPNAVKALVERTISEFGRVDILINNAGFIWEEPPEKVSLETWNKTLSINATGTFLCSQEAGKHMIKQRQGKIINIASISGLASVDPELSNTVPYSAAKGAIVALTRDLARKWCPHNITVNAIAPGYFGTKMSKYLAEHRQPQLMSAIHMKRLGTKDEIKGVAVFFASAASNYITGQILAVDGGIVM